MTTYSEPGSNSGAGAVRSKTAPALFLALSLTVSGAPAFAQPDADPEIDFRALGLPEEMVEALSPGPEHRLLDFMIGRFRAGGSMGGGGGQPADPLRGIVENRWTLSGHVLETEGKFDYLGQPLVSRDLWTYDRIHHQYQRINVDNWRTYAIVKTGMADPGGSGLTFFYDVFIPFSRDRLKIVEVISKLPPDGYRVESFEVLADGRREVRASIDFTRLKEKSEKGCAQDEAAKRPRR